MDQWLNYVIFQKNEMLIRHMNSAKTPKAGVVFVDLLAVYRPTRVFMFIRIRHDYRQRTASVYLSTVLIGI